MASVVTLKAGLDRNARAGEMTDVDIEKVIDIVSNPLSKFKKINSYRLRHPQMDAQQKEGSQGRNLFPPSC